MNVRSRLVKLLKQRRPLRADTRAATAVEYGLIVAVIVIASMIGIIAVADTTVGMWNNISDKVQRPR
jgi:pilus assembly protein Flp/PilA